MIPRWSARASDLLHDAPRQLQFVGTRRRRWLIGVLAVVVSGALAAIGFVYVFNQLGGTLGGFKNDEFATWVHTDMILSGQQPLRDFEEAGLRAVWPSLTFELPALAARLWGRNLFVHACLTLGALAFCRFFVFLLARSLSRGWIIATLASVLMLVTMPEPYNYPKLVVLTFAAVFIVWALQNPTHLRISVLAGWTVVSALFRHDFGVYVGLGTLVALVAAQTRPWTVPVRRVGVYAGIAALLSVPSLLWIQYHRGVALFLSEAMQSSGAEYEARRVKEWPVIHIGDLSGRDSLIAFGYYAFWMAPLIAICVLLVAGRRRTLASANLAAGWGLAAMAVVVNIFFLRSNLQARFGDAAVPLVLVSAWLCGAAAAFPSPFARRIARIGPAVFLLVLCALFISLNDIVPRLRNTGLTESLDATTDRFDLVKADLSALPPARWTKRPASGHAAVARYLAECTTSADAVLVGMYADDIMAFAGRRFAGGQAYFEGGFFQSDIDQQRAIERLARQSVPIAITEDDFEPLESDFPLIAHYLDEHYRSAGTVPGDDERPAIRIWVEAGRPVHHVDPLFRLPCFTN